MEQITAEGLSVANQLAQRFGFSQDAVLHMMHAVLRGRGGMAQFNHPEFAGSGQWMQGGMMMIGDMFNNSLKARVDGLCQAIAASLASQPDLFPAGSLQSQSQSGGGQQQQVTLGASRRSPERSAASSSPAPLFVPDPRDTWWPRGLGSPSATGSQNDVRYAYFADTGRLAVETNGRVTLHDTGDHRISGFSQQQAPGGAVVFSTPGGAVSLSNLPVASQQAWSSPSGSSQQQQVGGGQQQQVSLGGGSQQQSSTGMGSMSFQGGGMTPMTPMTPMSFGTMQPFEPLSAEPWWPAELGSASSSGSQGNLRYAVFPAAARLAVEVDGELAIHDTGGEAISGVSRQGQDGELLVATADGMVSLSRLPRVPLPSAEPPASAETPAAATAPQAQPVAAENEVLDALERLGSLKAKGILTEEEFSAKKAELLRRL